MSDENIKEVDKIAKDLVAEVAPEELDLFDELAREYHANPRPPQVTRGGGDDALGFGLDAAVAASSPAVIAAVSACFGFALQIASDAFRDQTKDFVKDQVKKLLGGRKSGPVLLHLDAAQLAHARDLAASEARRFGLNKADADRLADALAGRLAMNG
jgi:hypothetical protein